MWPAVLLLTCVLLLGTWHFLAFWSARSSLRPFSLRATDVEGFTPALPGKHIRRIPVTATENEPNLLAFLVSPTSAISVASAESPNEVSVLVRLAHGYNMPDCMRLKGYVVQWLRDMPAPVVPDTGKAALPPTGAGPRIQLWRLINTRGEPSLGATSILRAEDFSWTSLDVRAMPFPRVGLPNDPDWNPRGFSWSTLRHPGRELAQLVRARWNNARCDWLTFLRLRQPEGASAEYLSLVSLTVSLPAARSTDERILETVAAIHREMGEQLRSWRAATP